MYAGQLIEQCGLKGFSIGGAQVSEQHANFFVNANNATCDEMNALIEYVKKTVKEKKRVALELELCLPKMILARCVDGNCVNKVKL